VGALRRGDTCVTPSVFWGISGHSPVMFDGGVTYWAKTSEERGGFLRDVTVRGERFVKDNV
jgi:hypothetical protein